MDYRHSYNSDERKEGPPYSRIFVVCSKQICENDLRVPFKEFGTIEDIYMPKDRNTGESKGVAYIKYSKTSSAAAAVQKMNLKSINPDGKPLKVMIASNRNDNQDINEDKCKRLFIKVSKNATEQEIIDHFSKFGTLDAVHIQKDKNTGQNKGFAYVIYETFLDASKALEECDQTYKPVFATPKSELKRNRNSLEHPMGNYYPNGTNFNDRDNHAIADYYPQTHLSPGTSMMRLPHSSKPQGYKMINVTCTPHVAQRHIEKLFNIVPGLVRSHYTMDNYNGFCKVIITYDKEEQAAHACDRLNGFEFPSGEMLSVKPHKNELSIAANELSHIVSNFKNTLESGSPDLLQLANAIEQASSLIKKAATGGSEMTAESQEDIHCSVDLPPLKPLASSGSRVAQRCFLVFKPHPPPQNVLVDTFCRFGDLIEVSAFHKKTYGFAKYASVKAAQDAIKTLHLATICGITIKVLEAIEKPSKNEMEIDADSELSLDKKRMKLDD